MSKGLKGWVEAFRAGKHPGKGALAQHTFSRDDLDEMVANLNPSNPIPHVITHESLYSPFAYAQGIEAKRDGDVLLLRSDNINPDFEELVKTGALYERSVRIIKDAVKGFTLDHIAWLGAEPPAVSGLAPVEYAKDQEAYCDFSFVDTQTPYSLKKVVRSIRDWFVSEHGIETANSVIPEHDIESIEWAEQRAREEQSKQYKKDNPNNSIYSKQTGTDMDKFTQADIDAAVAKAEKNAKATAEADFKKKTDAQAALLTEERQKHLQGEWQGIADKAIEEGRLTPAQAEGLAEFAIALPVGEDAVVEFSRESGKGKKAEDIKKPLIEFLADFVASLPKQVAMSKDANGDFVDDGEDLDDTDSTAIAEKAVVYQKAQADKGLTISVSEAVQHVTKKDDK